MDARTDEVFYEIGDLKVEINRTWLDPRDLEPIIAELNKLNGTDQWDQEDKRIVEMMQSAVHNFQLDAARNLVRIRTVLEAIAYAKRLGA